MKNQEFGSMSLDDLWSLRESVNSELARKIAAEKALLDRRLRLLCPSENTGSARRAYPRVSPKYANPARPGETWSGRGKQPRWLTAQLSSGRKLDDFRIQPN
jgi:DNA-binding protein H-NS